MRTVAEAHARLRARADIQFDLNLTKPVPPPQPPAWLRALVEAIGALGPYAFYILWGALILLVLAVVFFAGRSYWRGRRSGEAVAGPVNDAAAWRPEERVARALLAEADEMAAAGRYEEATHLLLHRSLEDIQHRRPKALRPALTSREISRVDMLPALIRTAFAKMAAPVERSLFGGRSLERGDWEEARAAYGEFALPGTWK